MPLIQMDLTSKTDHYPLCHWIGYISYLGLAFGETIIACIRLIIVAMILKIVLLES